jgi:Fe-S-cluster containining protein
MNKQSPSWRCIHLCGACCRLCPEERGEALAALSEEQRATYLSMVGDDGWCIHYDSGGQRCTIYAERPDFCRVSELGTLFDVPPDELDSFAISCCRQQIRATYGGRSGVMRRFDRAQRTEVDRHD